MITRSGSPTAAGIRSGGTPRLRRGAITTPTNCDRFDSICAALAITFCGWSGGEARRAHLLALRGQHGVDEQAVAARVGMRPAEVCGLATSPISSRSDMTLRMVAGDRSSPEARDSVRDPTGCPSAM
jgi:hypothetical protein